MTITIHIKERPSDIELATTRAGEENASLAELNHATAIIERLPALYQAAGLACGAKRVAVFDKGEPR